MKVGVLGGGQLARMLALAGYPLNIQTQGIDPTEATCANQVMKVHLARYEDKSALQALASQVDVITYETENIPVATVEWLTQHYPHCPVYPNSKALALTQDRFTEKTFCQQLGIPTAKFAVVDSFDELKAAVEMIGLPSLLKTRRFGYDGKGQYVLKNPTDISTAWEALQGQSLILEEFIAFDTEVSLISVRSRDRKESRFYSLVENHHQQGILDYSMAPFIDEALQTLAQDYAQKMLNELDYVGVLAIEFFKVKETLIVNEMAPRVHNSGHWTIEGAHTSQFENHLRAITGLPLGHTGNRGVSIMLNCVGEEPPMANVLKMPDAHYHSYGKGPRANRKLGHITLILDNDSDLNDKIKQLKEVSTEGF